MLSCPSFKKIHQSFVEKVVFLFPHSFGNCCNSFSPKRADREYEFSAIGGNNKVTTTFEPTADLTQKKGLRRGQSQTAVSYYFKHKKWSNVQLLESPREWKNAISIPIAVRVDILITSKNIYPITHSTCQIVQTVFVLCSSESIFLFLIKMSTQSNRYRNYNHSLGNPKGR